LNNINNIKLQIHSQDLRHHINKPKISRTPPTKFVKASVMVMLTPGDTRYEKLELLNSLLAPLPGFVDLDWEFLNGNAHIVFRFNNRKLLLEAIDKALEQYPQAHFNVIDDHQVKNFESPTPIYKLKEVPYLIDLNDIKRAISYYGNVASLDEKHNYRNPSNRDVIITFSKLRKPQQLKEAWVVNISKYCIRCAHIDTSVDELKLRTRFVAGFKGFKEYTTASEAMRTMRPYNGRTCYFHGRIAYFAFATEEDMLNACNIRISHNEYLLDG
jgi:hypothetical protein